MKRAIHTQSSFPRHLSVCLAATALIGAVSGCAGSQAYASFIAEQRNRCYSVPEENYDACMAEAKERYEAYKRAQSDNPNNE